MNRAVREYQKGMESYKELKKEIDNMFESFGGNQLEYSAELKIDKDVILTITLLHDNLWIKPYHLKQITDVLQMPSYQIRPIDNCKLELKFEDRYL